MNAIMNARNAHLTRKMNRFNLMSVWLLLLVMFSMCGAKGQNCVSTEASIWFSQNDSYYWAACADPAIAPIKNPEITSCCGVAYMSGGGGSCFTTNPPTITIDKGNTECQVIPLTNSWGGIYWEVSNPKKSGTVTITVTLSAQCPIPGTDPVQYTPATCTTVGTLEVNLPGHCEINGGGGGGGGGCGSCGSGPGPKSPGSGTAANNCLDFRLYLGATSMFDNDGYISLYADAPSAALATPAALNIPFDRQNVEVVTNSSGVITQVKTPLVLVNVVSNTPYQFQLQVFSQDKVTGTSAPYGTNGPAFTTWTIDNPDANAAFNRLWITEQRPGETNRQFQYTYSNIGTQAQRWDLLEPDGMTTYSKWCVADSLNPAVTNYYWQTTSGTNILRYVCSTVEAVPVVNGVPGDGELTLTTTEGYGSATRSTVYTYYSSNAPAGSANRLQRVDYSNGGWDYYVYDSEGRIATNYSAFNNNPPPTSVTTVPDPLVDLCKETDYTYDDTSVNPFEAVQVVTSVPVQVNGSWQLQEISRNYSYTSSGFHSQEQCSQPGAGQGSPGNLVTMTYAYDQWDPASAGRTKSVSYPDGTASFYTYALTSTNFTTVESTGQPDYWWQPSSITDGKETTMVIDSLGRIQSKIVKDIQTGITLSQETYYYSTNDPLGSDYSVVDLAGRTNTYEYACCGLDSSLDPDGVGASYAYDSMKRVTSTSVIRGSSWVSTTNAYNGLGRVLLTQRIGTTNSTMTLSQSEYDVLGRVIRETNALNGVTRYDYSAVDHQLYVTNTYPDGGTRIEVYQRDGRLQSVSGTAVSPIEYKYGVEEDASGYWHEYTLEIMLDANDGTNEWTKTYTDAAGRTYKTVYSGATSNPFTMYYYDQNIPGCQLTNQVDPDGVSTFYGYDDQGRQDLTVVDINQDGNINYDGKDQITLTTNDVVSDHGCDVNRTRTFVWATNSDNTPTLVSTREVSTDGLRSWNTVWNNGVGVTSQSVTVYAGNGYRYVTNTGPDNSYTDTTYHYGQMVSTKQHASNGDQIGQASYGYDAFYRQNTMTDARNGTTTKYYNNADQVTSIVTPPPASGQSAEVTTNTFDQMGRELATTQPDNTLVSNVYYPNGLLALTYGSRTYPVGYSYDAQGRMKTMTNWTSFASAAGARVTTWNYDPYRGFLSSKDYADGNGPSYCYTAAGRLATRTWARGVVTSYYYDAAGSLTNIAYSDSTPAVTNTYDRLGRLISVDCNGMIESLVYNDANKVLSDTYSGGILNGVGVTNSYDQYLRRTNVMASSASAQLLSTAYGYDNASRLQIVSDGTDNATYTYLDNSPLVSQIFFKKSGATRMTTTKQYDYLNRLTQISSTPSGSGAVPETFNYDYNTANQRTKDTLVDGSYWVYQYDALGQVTSGKKYWSDGTPVAGQQFGYTFDDIGNRKQTQRGGDASGGNLRTALYSANDLNQITSRDYPGTNDIVGVALATNSVTVNGQTAYRHGEYFWSTVQTNNTASPKWQGVTVASGGTTNTGGLFVPQTPEQFKYDADGNLTNDGHWSYVWDAENRLTQMAVNTNVGPQYQLTFVYDSKGRRIEKIVALNGVAVSTNKFLYDGWNLIAILNPQSSILQAFLWGTDLSGSMQGAGGVGGLLEVSYGTTNCFPAFDGNGNVMALINANDGTTLANYEYGPFGEVIRATGPMAKANPIRWSTKYQDNESDLLYYGYRYYKPSTGTWPNRDPLGELGFENLRHRLQSAYYISISGVNLYILLNNQPISSIDLLGLQVFPCGPNQQWVTTREIWYRESTFEVSLTDALPIKWPEKLEALAKAWDIITKAHGLFGKQTDYDEYGGCIGKGLVVVCTKENFNFDSVSWEPTSGTSEEFTLHWHIWKDYYYGCPSSPCSSGSCSSCYHNAPPSLPPIPLPF